MAIMRNIVAAILIALSEREITRRVALRHDHARLQYRLERITVDTFDEFADLIGDYYNYHFAACVSGGTRLPHHEAVARAKELLDHEYRRRHIDIASAFADAQDGQSGAMRGVLDTLADGLKFESIERYIRGVFDQIAPNDWELKVEVIRQFIQKCGDQLAPSFRADQPERYAQNYQELIRSYVNGLRETAAIFRRL